MTETIRPQHDRRAETPDEALLRLMQAWEVPIRRMCCVYLRDEDMARDAVQETFLKAYRGLSGFRGESSERTWLMRIAINTCRDMRKAAWFRFVDRRVTLEKLPEPVAETSWERTDLTLDVMKLPTKLLDVVLLHFYQGMSVREVGAALGIPYQTVTSRLKAACAKLRVQMEEGGNRDD
ncbi:MAG: sigma-70 family RNA polymerase sigma factor [Christensenellaceae bacterium]|nr:sigma-70 family RNA polymerase sigma factor [Christensenellaceae bacterium]